MPFWDRFRRVGNRNGGRGLVIAVLVIGVLSSGGLAAYLQTAVADEGRDELANHGELLSDSALSDLGLVADQLRSFRGLFEASELVTKEEFGLFSRVVGFSPSSVLLFAPLDEGGASSGTVSWPVKFVVANRPTGPSLGENLSNDPTLEEAIDRAVFTGQPTVSRFLVVEGDSRSGDLALFQSVTTAGRVVGVVGAVIQIDERLQDVADLVLGPGESWTFEESLKPTNGISTSYLWSRSIRIGGQGFLISIASDRLQSAGASRPLGALGVGILITLVAARMVGDSQRRHRTDREIEWLRRSSADKDRFLAGVGHELRTPLTAVVGMLELASNPNEDFTASERTDLVATARTQANEIARIVDDFVTAGRLSADALTIRMQPIDLDPLLSKLIASTPPDRRLEVRTTTGLGICLGDSLRITQIMINLLDNARRNAQHLVEISGRVDDEFVTVEVSNDGPSIPAERAESIYEPFMAQQPEGQPLPIGVGLSVSRALARRMGGDLVHEWRDGLVVFALSLPVVPAPIELESSGALSI
ncbi:MAG TPA: HAMP domain-containing sensor histidine kinase [Acidimicrobiia bacterium]|nr:HAMP domain-containing sensor histidine kinase [Acidimicrobiia bacterium]